ASLKRSLTSNPIVIPVSLVILFSMPASCWASSPFLDCRPHGTALRRLAFSSHLPGARRRPAGGKAGPWLRRPRARDPHPGSPRWVATGRRSAPLEAHRFARSRRKTGSLPARARARGDDGRRPGPAPSVGGDQHFDTAHPHVHIVIRG